MRTRVVGGLFGLLAAAVLGASSWAQQPANQTNVWIIAPQNRVQIIEPRVPNRPPGAVTLSKVESSASIDDQVASTTIVMTLSNSAGTQQEAQVLVPVPAGATVRSFQLDSAGTEPTAKILPREEARRIYDSIVRASRDPGLLEFVGFNLLKSSVFPVPANGTQTVRLTYESLLTADTSSAGTRVDYVLPRTESLQAAGTDWGFSGEIRSRRAIASVYSPSHEITTERVGPGHVKIKTAKSAGAAGTLRVSYLLEPEKSNGLAASLLMYPDPEVGSGKGGYFMLMGGFPTGELRRQTMKREVTIVLDRSGSMRGEKIEQAREGALQVIEGLAEGEYFNIIDYSDSIASFSDKPVKKDAEAMTRARDYLKDLQANGGTNIHDALIEALRQKPTENTLPVVLFLTDGLPTVGKTSEKEIRDAAQQANGHERRIFTFGVGVDVNSPLLSKLSDISRGAPTFVLPGEDVEVKVSQVFRRLSGPVFAGMKVTASSERGIREILPRSLPDMFDGDQVIILGQYTQSEPMKIVLAGNYLGEKREFEISLDPGSASTRNSYVPRMWATRMVGELLDQIRQASTDGTNAANDPKTKELVDEIVRLSTKWGILTEYTAFLVQEPPGTVTAARELGRMPALEPMAPAAEAPTQLRARIEERAADRSGSAAVNQEMNLYASKTAAAGQGGGKAQAAQAWYNEKLERVEARGAQQVSDKTFLWRNSQWIDSRALAKEQEKPDRVVEFGTPEYDKLVDDLLAQDLQGVLAMVGDVVVVSNGQRVLIKMPTEG
jgi:Ca-activated chloride channel family protein